MEVIDTVLTKYAPSDGRRPAKVWDAAGNDYAIWDNMGLFETLKSLIGTPVRLAFESKPSADGRFQNRSAQAVEVTGSIVSGMVAPAVPPQAIPTALPTPTPVVIQDLQPIEYQRAKHPDEQKAIRKAVALQCAVAALPYMERKFETAQEVEVVAAAWELWLSQD